MANDQQNDFQSLLQKVEDIRQKQFLLQNELFDVREKIIRLRKENDLATAPQRVENESSRVVTPPQTVRTPPQPPQEKIVPQPSPILKDWEQFIGENLSNKIGIVITVLGVAIGAKYAIDNELISPLLRILIGYGLGIGLCLVSFRLREKYEDLSAVILSGALACLYFLTYAAFSFYQLIPQTLSFILMLALTLWAVRAALSYDRQIIALGALMGAYGIPFLLSTGEDKPLILFTYMTVVNIGILYLATKKNWNSLYYTAFAFTWILMLTWSSSGYPDKHFYLKLSFLLLFFVIFYATFLVYKIQKQIVFQRRDVVLLLLNSTFYYGLTYRLLDIEGWNTYLGLFTVCNALMHLSVAFFIYQKELVDKNIFYLIQGLFIAFLSIAIPVQLDGNWVTLLWFMEGALLFWIGRTKENSAFYEKISYGILAIALLSLRMDWSIQDSEMSYDVERIYTFVPFFNIGFLTNVIASAVLMFILKTHHDTPLSKKEVLQKQLQTGLFLLVIALCYKTFQIEISLFFEKIIQNTAKTSATVSQSWIIFRNICLISYSMVFVGGLFYLNQKRFKNVAFADFINVLSGIVLLVFLISGLYDLGTLKNNYQYIPETDSLTHSSAIIWIRYIAIAFAMIPLYVLNEHFKQKISLYLTPVLIDSILNISALWLVSSELIYWSEWFGWYEQSYRLSLSLLWGTYALGSIFYGIKNAGKKHLRLGGIALFAITLLKLFLFDLANLGTISKTILLVGLGLLLLLVSYLYNRYKDKFDIE
jgi:Predicted membrane protein (DUF2339)